MSLSVVTLSNPCFVGYGGSRECYAHSLVQLQFQSESPGESPHPFLPRLYAAFDHDEFRFLVLKFCSGGDLNSLQRSLPDKRFSPTAIRFYAAEIVLALEHLHAQGIVYRDLKPENILLSADGHIVLSDFDLSIILTPKVLPPSLASPDTLHRSHQIDSQEIKDYSLFTYLKKCYGRSGSVRDHERIAQRTASSLTVSHTSSRKRVVPSVADKDTDSSKSSNRSKSSVGTEPYVAPEMIKGSGHDYGVDWWALGVLLFEMAHGSTPFSGRTTKDTFRNILRLEPTFPGLTSESLLSDLIRQLLIKDPTQRLGAHGGAAEVKSHAFFAGLKWDALLNVCRPPFVPLYDRSEFDGSASFDLLTHLGEVDNSREEAREKRKLKSKQDADCPTKS
ncbi:hypothetical protein KP509_38G039600 [Ceratopteris richardii]|uniref:non-specific serine/threonine protein kinase n=1 Tax=Ceratopteris richardii TaxID=49495 RepID=A0A8T2Q446_CERRI|nr:hypothetical protein KP509_38G039600 [Ceratopteris richardii]